MSISLLSPFKKGDVVVCKHQVPSWIEVGEMFKVRTVSKGLLQFEYKRGRWSPRHFREATDEELKKYVFINLEKEIQNDGLPF